MSALVALLAGVACTAPVQETAPAAAPVPTCRDVAGNVRTSDWRRVASDDDRARLRDWREAWTSAVAGEGGRTAADPALFALDRSLDDALPPLGVYRCRTHRFGAAVQAMPSWGGCRIEEDKGAARLVVEDGAQRPVGHLYADTASRAVFLGTVTIGDEARPLRYGRDRLRDLAGFVERVEERRWRIALPRPSFGGTLEIIELVPA